MVYLDDCIIFHCINAPQFIYPNVDRQTACFQFGEFITSGAIMSICIHAFGGWAGEGCIYVCISIVYTFRRRIAGSLGKNN